MNVVSHLVSVRKITCHIYPYFPSLDSRVDPTDKAFSTKHLPMLRLHISLAVLTDIRPTQRRQTQRDSQIRSLKTIPPAVEVT